MKMRIKSTGQLCYMFDNTASGSYSKVLIPHGHESKKGEQAQIATVKSSNLEKVVNFTG